MPTKCLSDTITFGCMPSSPNGCAYCILTRARSCLVCFEVSVGMAVSPYWMEMLFDVTFGIRNPGEKAMISSALLRVVAE